MDQALDFTPLREGGVAAEPNGWQQRKSAEMRSLVLETAIDCLVEDGYAGFSVQRIARRAGVSRGALLHHFATKGDLVSAVVEYTFQIRIQTFLADFEHSCARGNDRVETAAGMYWDSVQTREFAAYLELVVAARTDGELRELLLPEIRRYDRLWSEEMTRTFPQWDGNSKMLQLSGDFVAVAHLGLLLQPEWEPERVNAVLGLVEATVALLYRAHKDSVAQERPAS